MDNRSGLWTAYLTQLVPVRTPNNGVPQISTHGLQDCLWLFTVVYGRLRSIVTIDGNISHLVIGLDNLTDVYEKMEPPVL